MADAKFTSEQLAQMLRRLDDVVSHAQSVRNVIIEAMAARRRTGSPATSSLARKRTRRRSSR